MGDGCGLLFVEIESYLGEVFDFYFKGVGLIFYFWMGDGWVVLCLIICEYLCSEVMVGLGIVIIWVLVMMSSDMLVYRE